MTDEIPDTWPEWTDVLGQVYRPSDFIAYAAINGRSPQMVMARVIEIRRRDSKGKEVTERRWDTPDGTYAAGAKLVMVPSCKVKVMPMLDARGFSRGDWKTGDKRAVTLSIPQNIIRIEPRPEWTDEFLAADLNQLREELQ